MGEHDMDPSWPSAEAHSVSDGLDLDGWIDGTCRLTRSAKVFQRGDLLTQILQLESEREISIAELDGAKKTAAKDRGLTDRTPDLIQAEIDELTRQIDELSETAAASALTVHVQDRTEVRRETIRMGVLKKLGIDKDKLTDASPEDRETVSLHVLADAIIKVEQSGKTLEFPDGFPVPKLRSMVERLGDAAFQGVWTAYYRVTSEAPDVSAPLSRRSSFAPGGIT
jgi:hypothetical protein